MRKKDKKHIETRSLVEKLTKMGLNNEEISNKLHIPIGKNQNDRETIKWYNHCIISVYAGRKAIRTQRKLGVNFFNSSFQSKMGKRGAEVCKRKKLGAAFNKTLHKKITNICRKKKIGIFDKNVQSKAGKIGGKKAWKITYDICKKNGLGFFNPKLQSELGKRSMKKRKDEGKFIEHQKMAGKSAGKKSAERRKSDPSFNDYMNKCSKKGAITRDMRRLEDPAYNKRYLDQCKRAGQLSIESRRRNFPYEFMENKFDSNEEREVCRLLVRHKIIDKPVEGVNVHFRVNGGEIDFFLKDTVFLEFHPCNIFYHKENYDEYYQRRRHLLDRNGYKHIPLIVLQKLDEFETMVLPLFGGGV